MSEDDRVPWEDSNLALIGSDIDHKVKEAAAEGEPAWDGLGTEPCLKIWRMEQFKVKEWTETPGHFHTGDSYIVLNSYLVEDKICHDLHFWIGSESSQDEYGTAAYKTVECDDSLGGSAVQHREVQGYESELFRSYFEELYYLQGGVDSGFTHVEPTKVEPHLYQIKGRRTNLSLTQVPLQATSLNAGDSFLLMCGPGEVYLWNGAESNRDERLRANTLGESMATESTLVVLDQGEGDAADSMEAFWAHLGGSPDDVGPADHEGDHDVEEFMPLLYKLPSEGDAELVAEGEPIKIGWAKATPKMERSLLDEADVFLLDAGWEVFVWQGKDSDHSEKLACMAHVDAFSASNPRVKHLPVSILKSGWETAKFNSFFI